MFSDAPVHYKGVAYAPVPKTPQSLSEPSIIQNWPYTKSTERHNKVPTRLAYSKIKMDEKTDTSRWGFGATRRVTRGVHEHFKLDLDKTIVRESYMDENAEQSEIDHHHDVAKLLTRNYLTHLYAYIKDQFAEKIEPKTPWSELEIEFLFSFPTAWNSNVVETYRTIIQEAGYSKVRGHTAETSITEAEAAVIYTAMHHTSAQSGCSSDLTASTVFRQYKVCDRSTEGDRFLFAVLMVVKITRKAI